MASGQITTKKVQVMVTKDEKEIVLTLSEHEAQVIRTLVGSIIGTGPSRDVTSRLFDILSTDMGLPKIHGLLNSVVVFNDGM